LTFGPTIARGSPFGGIRKGAGFWIRCLRKFSGGDVLQNLYVAQTSLLVADRKGNEGSNPTLSATQSGLRRNLAAIPAKSLEMAAISRILPANRTKADARDLDTGEPTPEAPRTIFDLLGTIQKLPFRPQARGEFEYVGTKPLGTGCNPANLNSECTGTPVKEFRGAVVRPFLNGRMDAGVNFLVASGYSGQTTENFYPSEIQEVVGVRIPSYASVTLTYSFGRTAAPENTSHK